MDRYLTNVQRKQLHELLVKADVDSNVTHWSNSGMGWTGNNCETLHAGLCHFLIKPGSDGLFSIHFKPSWNGGGPFGDVNKSWKEVLEIFDFWTHKVKEELDQPDPWGTYALAAFGVTRDHSTDNAPFTHSEAEHVAESVTKLLAYFKEVVPEFNEFESEFTPQFERIAEQAKSGTGRIDWKNQLVGMLINIFVSLSLSPERAAAIWNYWQNLVDSLLLS